MLISTEVKIPETYDSWFLTDIDFPSFPIPLHSTFDGIKLIPEFDIQFLEKNGLVNKRKKNDRFNLVFLKNFGKCNVLKGLKDSAREFNILCVLYENSNVNWLYLTNEEYAEFLVRFNEKDIILNVENKYNPLKIGKIYRLKENIGTGVYKDYKISISKYDPSDIFSRKAIIGIGKTYTMEKNEEFLVLKRYNMLENIDSLEQQDITYTSRSKIIADDMYFILGVGSEFIGYIPKPFNFHDFYEEVKTD